MYKKILIIIILLFVSGWFSNMNSQEQIISKKQIFQESDSLFKVGNRFFQERQYDSAAAIWQLSLKGFESLGENKATLALLNNLAMTYKQLKDFDNYLFVLEKQKNLANAAGDLKNRSITEISLAFFWADRLQFNRADSLMESALAAVRTLGNKKETAQTLIQVAGMKQRQSKLIPAMEMFEEAARLFQDLSDSAGYGQARLGSGIMNLQLGNYRSSEHNLEEAISIKQRFSDPKGLAKAYTNLGIVYDHLGQTDQAESCYTQAFHMYESLQMKDGMADILMNTGVLQHNRGQFQKALNSYRNAYQLIESGKSRESLGQVLTNLGLVYRDMNDLDTALIYLNQAIQTEREIRDWRGLAADLSITGNIYWRRSDYVKAKNAVEEAVSIRQGIGDRRGLSNDLIYLGIILSTMTESEMQIQNQFGGIKPDTALALFRSALEIKKDIGDFNGEVTALTYLGQTYRIMREYGEAVRYLKEADSLTNTRNGNTLRWQIKYELAKTFEKKGENDAAVHEYIEAIVMVENQRAMLQSEDFRMGFFKDKSFLYADAISLLYKLQRFGEAFELAERSRSRTFLDMLGSRFMKTLHRSEDLQRLDSIEALISEKEKNASGQSNIKDMNTLLAARKSIMAKIRESGEEMSSLITVTPFSVDSLRAMIPADQTILEYYNAQGELYIFIVSRMTVHCVRVEISNYRFITAILNFRQELQNYSSQKYKAHAKALYQILIQPVIGHIKTERLIIVPHERLHYIPFAALMDEQEKFLIDRFTILTLPGANLLRFVVQKRKLQEADKANLSFLGFGNPYVPALPRLKEAENEIRSIGEMFGYKEIYLREGATKTAFKKSSPHYDVIHFACHGIFDIDEPLNSALMLSKDTLSAGKLTVRELFSCSLPKVRLVVLSACETGLAKLIKGDELIGFSRAFIYAGAPSIISSLWQVSDEATSKLMIDLYKKLDIADKPGSLRNAQLNLKSVKSFEHPFFWSAFQITGDWQ